MFLIKNNSSKMRIGKGFGKLIRKYWVDNLNSILNHA